MSTVMATFVFTDLVGSTALASSLGPTEAEELRLAHFGVLRAAIDAAGGTEVKNLGDGLMAVFTSPSRALSCAAGMQQGIERHNRRGNTPLSVRIGLSAGEAVEEDGDFFGDPVIEAARLCACAEGGHILTTALLRAMVGRHATQEFRDVGALELKGLPDPVPAVEVVWEAAVDEGRPPMPARLIGAASESLFGFFGRAAELEQLASAYKHAVSEAQLRVVLISGEGGMGKTSLVAQAARVAHAEGATVVLGYSQEGLAMPYQPWVGALSQLVAHSDESVLESLDPRRAAALARLLPEQAGRIPTPGGAPGTSDADTERFVLLQSIVDLLRAASAEAPLVVVLDDLHWADDASLQTLHHVVASAEPMRVLVLATYRETDLGQDHPLVAVLADLHRATRATRMPLDGLDSSDLAELLEAAAGHSLDDDGTSLAHALRRETGGNPFFTGELLRELAASEIIFQDADGHWAVRGDLSDLRLPGSVRETVGRRIDRLGEETRRVFSIAAVIGREFDVGVLASVADADEDDVLDLLERAASAGLVVESEDSPGRYRFVHALFQHTLYQDLSATRRQRTHQRVAEAIESVSGTGDEHVAELARHWVEATRPAELERALHYSERAGDVALRSLAPLDAVRWYGQALELCDRMAAPDAAHRCRLLIGLGTAQRQAGEAEHRTTLLSAAAEAQELGDDDALVRAALANTRGFWSSSGEADQERIAVFEAALGSTSDPRARSRLASALAIELSFLGDLDRRRSLSDEAVAIARTADDPVLLTQVLLDRCYATWAPETFADRQDASREALELAESIGDPTIVSRAVEIAQNLAYERGDRDMIDRCQDRFGALVEELGQATLQWQVQFMNALGVLLAGEVERADELTASALETGMETGQPDAFEIYGAQLLEVRRVQGRLGEIVDMLASLVEEDPNIPAFRAALANAYCILDQPDDARPLLTTDIVDAHIAGRRDSTWMTGLVIDAESVAMLGLEPQARALYDALRPYGEQIAYTGASVHGPVSHYLGLLSAAFGDTAVAESHFTEAMAAHDRLRSPYFRAVTEVAFASLLMDRDPTRASSLLERARASASQHGFPDVERDAARLVGP